MDKEKIRDEILEEYHAAMNRSQKVKAIDLKIRRGEATYAEAQDLAIESGKNLTNSMRKHLPNALTDTKLYRETANTVVKQPMIESAEEIGNAAARIQQDLNELADIGINAITPEISEEHIDGIITEICNAESYESGKETLFDQIGNFLEGRVDDFVQENASFQQSAGLSPTIERIPDGNCCPWCSALAGTYDYSTLHKGGDVFRRHNNCHCRVLFNPGDGSKRRQNVHSKIWADEVTPEKIEERKNFVGLDLQRISF